MLDLEAIKARLDATPPQIGHFTWQQGSDTIYGLATGAPAEWFYSAAQTDMRALIAEVERLRTVEQLLSADLSLLNQHNHDDAAEIERLRARLNLITTQEATDARG